MCQVDLPGSTKESGHVRGAVQVVSEREFPVRDRVKPVEIDRAQPELPVLLLVLSTGFKQAGVARRGRQIDVHRITPLKQLGRSFCHSRQ